jgi:hypothetical protein
MEASEQPHGALLVGSVPLDSATQVFESAASMLGAHLRRIPDGETGERLRWVGWQFEVFANHPAFEVLPPLADSYAPVPRVRLRDPSRAPVIGELGYARAARTSYEEFARLQLAGVIPARCRFQVSLPTPLAPLCSFVIPEHQAMVEPAYEERLLTELDQICATIAPEALAVQWDVAIEVAIWEGMWPVYFTECEPEILSRLIRIGDRVPRGVELGYHLCYGDYAHHHFKQPRDLRILVAIANALIAGVRRPIDWLHLPVPRDRDDDVYFAPLHELRRPPATELYLGLVHLTDGLEGARRRIASARRVVDTFGISTECGMGRRPAESIRDLLRLHAALAKPWS